MGTGRPISSIRIPNVSTTTPTTKPVSMKERNIDELMSDKGEEAAYVASRSAAQAEKDVSLETVNR